MRALDVGGFAYISWICCVGVVLVMVGPPFHRRYLTLKALVLLNKVLIICGPAFFALLLLGERMMVSCQFAVSGGRLRYLIIKRFIHKLRCAGCARCAPNKAEQNASSAKKDAPQPIGVSSPFANASDRHGTNQVQSQLLACCLGLACGPVGDVYSRFRGFPCCFRAGSSESRLFGCIRERIRHLRGVGLRFGQVWHHEDAISQRV